ncbi:MAG: glycosyltransferase [Clostridia bacterium]|nr:glycosyltransferase [Clostridia bacterium]
MRLSVLMSVYKNETVENFSRAMDSVLTQSVQPDQIVLVRDGEVPEALQTCIDSYVTNYALFKYIPLEVNGGLGNALRIGLDACDGEIVARMDTDDICADGRFEKQLKFLNDNPEIDVVGGQIEEFIGEESNIVAKRFVPQTDEKIKQFLKTRCPFNHPAVAFRKASVLAVGSYEPFFLLEDYYLWCKMAMGGCKFANLSDTLVYMRMTEDSYRRRGGMKYFRSFKKLEKFKKQKKMIGFWKYHKNLFVRFAQGIMPSAIRQKIYKQIRKK